MTQKDKELLLKDLCARLPYKPIVQIDDCGIWNLRGIDHDDSAELRDRVIVWHGETYPSSKNSFPIINCKPYLFPLSSMTEEQCEELRNLIYEHFTLDDEFNEGIRFKTYGDILVWLDEKPINKCYFIFDYFNKNHFDYRGLIPKGLANDATGLSIY